MITKQGISPVDAEDDPFQLGLGRARIFVAGVGPDRQPIVDLKHNVGHPVPRAGHQLQVHLAKRIAVEPAEILKQHRLVDPVAW